MHFFCLPTLYLLSGGLKYWKGVYTAIQTLYKYLFNTAAVGQCVVCEVWAFIASRFVLMLTQSLKSKADRGRHETHPGGLHWGIYDHFTLDQDGTLFTAFLQALVIFKGSDLVLNNLWTGNECERDSPFFSHLKWQRVLTDLSPNNETRQVLFTLYRPCFYSYLTQQKESGVYNNNNGHNLYTFHFSFCA